MKLYSKKILILVLILVVSAFGYRLRMRDFNKVPFPGESLDEYSNAWVGLSMIRLGVPVGMSGLPGYRFYDSRYINVDRVYQETAKGNTMQINYPWFDHPPMMGVLVGGFGYFKGARVFEDMTASIVRKPIILFASVSIFLTGILAWQVFGPLAGIASTLIMATSPIMVINSRSVQAENGFLPLFLLSLIFLRVYQNKNNRIWLFLCAILTGLALLFKLSAGAILIAILALMLTDNNKKFSVRLQECVVLGTVSISFLGLFFVMGLALDSQTFFRVFLSNSNRAYGIGLGAIADLINTVKAIGGKSLADGWPLVGWMGIIALIRGRKNSAGKYIWIPLLSYLAIYLFFGSESFAWYRFPFMPFLMITAGYLATLVYRNLRYMPISILSLLIPLGINLDKFREVNNMPGLTGAWRLSMFGLLGISLLLSSGRIRKNRYARLAVYLIMAGVFSLTIYSNWLRLSMINVDYWYHSS